MRRRRRLSGRRDLRCAVLQHLRRERCLVHGRHRLSVGSGVYRHLHNNQRILQRQRALSYWTDLSNADLRRERGSLYGGCRLSHRPGLQCLVRPDLPHPVSGARHLVQVLLRRRAQLQRPGCRAKPYLHLQRSDHRQAGLPRHLRGDLRQPPAGELRPRHFPSRAIPMWLKRLHPLRFG